MVISTNMCSYLSCKTAQMHPICEMLATQSCPTPCDPMDWDLPGSSVVNTGVGCHFLLQEIFHTPGLDPWLLHCRQTLYHVSHQGSSSLLII